MTHDDHADDSDGIDPAQVEVLLAEYRAAVEKIDATVAQLSVRAEGQLACRKGCAQCCVAGLSVLPVEALAIEAHAAATGARAPAPRSDGHCAFLDDTGACSIYAARPVLCRTHGLAMRGAAEQGPGPRLFRVVDPGDAPQHADRGVPGQVEIERQHLALHRRVPCGGEEAAQAQVGHRRQSIA